MESRQFSFLFQQRNKTFSLMNENSPGWTLLNQDPYQWKCSQVLPKYTVSWSGFVCENREKAEMGKHFGGAANLPLQGWGRRIWRSYRCCNNRRCGWCKPWFKGANKIFCTYLSPSFLLENMKKIIFKVFKLLLIFPKKWNF